MNLLGFYLYAAGLPTLGALKDWIIDEGGNAVAIVLVGFAIFYLVKQSWGKLIGFLIVAALVFFAVGNPEAMLTNLESIADTVLGR